MNWLTYAILAASSFGLYNFFLKLSSSKFSPPLANFFITGVAFLVTAIIVVYLKTSGQELVFSKENIKLPIIAGLSVGAAGILYLTMFTKHAPFTIGYPLVTSGAIIVALILGFLILKEPLNTIKIAGIIFTLTGLILLARS